jgi:hypothetical protein
MSGERYRAGYRETGGVTGATAGFDGVTGGMTGVAVEAAAAGRGGAGAAVPGVVAPGVSGRGVVEASGICCGKGGAGGRRVEDPATGTSPGNLTLGLAPAVGGRFEAPSIGTLPGNLTPLDGVVGNGIDGWGCGAGGISKVGPSGGDIKSVATRWIATAAACLAPAWDEDVATEVLKAISFPDS